MPGFAVSNKVQNSNIYSEKFHSINNGRIHIFTKVKIT